MNYYCTRDLAIDFILAKTGKDTEHLTNLELDNLLCDILGNENDFLVINGDAISYMPKSRPFITEYSLNQLVQ